MREVTLSPTVYGFLGNPLPIYADRFSGHHGQQGQAIDALALAFGRGAIPITAFTTVARVKNGNRGRGGAV